MRMKNFYWIPVFFVLTLPVFSCQKEEAVDPVLVVSQSEITVEPEGGEATVTVECSDEWVISNSATAWLEIDKANGLSGKTTLTLTISINETGASRTGIVSINAANEQSRRVVVRQTAWLFPTYNTSPKAPDATGMSSNAAELAAKMKLGWNVGNTMESPGGESGWGNPSITGDYIKFVKEQGFNAIRLPCAWDWHHLADKTAARIDPAWMNRVKEVVGYCVENDMYVLLNIHWDGGWLENNVTVAKKDSVNAKQKAYWEQIATALRDFDEHLMFASANEPAADNAEKVGILLSHHQTFINAVRSTGGRNSYRVLVVQGPNTSMSLTSELMSTLPADPVANRLMVEIHNYTPAQFCFLNEDVSWGKMFYYWGQGHHSTIEPDRNATWGEEDVQLADFAKVKAAFVDKGIPVILGEYGAYRRNNSTNVPLDLETHEASVDYWTTFVTKQAIAHGVIPFWWDTGGALDRANNTVKDQRTIDAILAATK